MMGTTSFQDIVLATGDVDGNAVLVLRDGKLVAILSHLSDLHDDLAGKWFVEVMFGWSLPVPRQVFVSPDAFVHWLDGTGPHR